MFAKFSEGKNNTGVRFFELCPRDTRPAK